MSKALHYILAKYPDHASKIIELYKKDEDFRLLCEDWLTTAKSLEEYRLSGIKDRESENEFAQVYLELEKEISRLLSLYGH